MAGQQREEKEVVENVPRRNSRSYVLSCVSSTVLSHLILTNYQIFTLIDLHFTGEKI